MRKIITASFIILSGFCLLGADKVLLEYFYSTDCADCKRISSVVLPSLQTEMGAIFEVEYFDLADENNLLHLLEHLHQANDDSNEKGYIIVNQKIVVGGRNNIEKNLAGIIQIEYQSAKIEKEPQLATAAPDYREKIKLPMVIIAGLLDGINPCVFATLVFFISLLSSAGRIKIIKIGIVYILAGFLTYFAIGIGLYKTLGWINSISSLRPIINGIMLAGLLIFAVISFTDAFRFRKSDTKGVLLQLPNRLKKYIHRLMRERRNQTFLLAGTFTLGVLVTLLESVCTGQVYVPTILLLATESGGMNRWWLYLLLYNVMFIIPLMAIFALTVWSFRIHLLLKLSRHDVIVSKVLMGLFFLLLAIALAFFELFR